jgi:hypothetical protein
MQLAELKYKTNTDETKKEKVQLYLEKFVFTREKNAFKHKTDSYADWLIELETDKLVSLLRSWKPAFREEFLKYASRSIIDKEPVMDAKIMYKYCADKDIIPQMLNRTVCFRLFKECQRAEKADIHKEYLTFLEFMEFISFIGVHYFTQNIKDYPKLNNFEKKVEAMFRWLEKKIDA